MTTLISSISDLIALFIQSFNIAALLPSFTFTLLNYIFVWPYLKNTYLYDFLENGDTGVQVLLLATIAIFLAYLLNSANIQLIRWLEGYPLKDQYPFDKWIMKHKNRIYYLNHRIYELEKGIDLRNRSALSLPTEHRSILRQQAREMESEKLALMAEQFSHYPQNQDRALPTRLGNIIASAEEYPSLLFGIDAVLMWPYLTPALAKSGYAKFMEREKSIFDLMLNSAVLATSFGLEVAYLGFFFRQMSITWILALICIGAAALIFVWLATDSAMGWAQTLRAAFVLHRHDLRELLGVRKPNSYKDERKLWKQVVDFYRQPSYASGLGVDQTSFFAYELLHPTGNAPHAAGSQHPLEDSDASQT